MPRRGRGRNFGRGHWRGRGRGRGRGGSSSDAGPNEEETSESIGTSESVGTSEDLDKSLECSSDQTEEIKDNTEEEKEGFEEEPGDTEGVFLKEGDVGITEYISSSPGFSAIIKQRMKRMMTQGWMECSPLNRRRSWMTLMLILTPNASLTSVPRLIKSPEEKYTRL